MGFRLDNDSSIVPEATLEFHNSKFRGPKIQLRGGGSGQAGKRSTGVGTAGEGAARRSQARRVARPWQHRGEQERNGGACRARGNARRAGSGQTQGRGSGFGRRRDAWGGQVASPAYGAAVGEVQGDGGGRNSQWQFRN